MINYEYSYPFYADYNHLWEVQTMDEVPYYERITTIGQLKIFFAEHNTNFELKKGSFKVTVFDGEKDVNFPEYKHICMRLSGQRDKTLTMILHKKTKESELTIQERDMIFVTSKGQWIVSRCFLTKKNLILSMFHK